MIGIIEIRIITRIAISKFFLIKGILPKKKPKNKKRKTHKIPPMKLKERKRK